MTDLFKDFDKVSKEEWKTQIISDLKGKSHDVLEIYDEIEEIQFDAYYHRTDINEKKELPGNFPFKRGSNTPNNHWGNSVLINVVTAEEANALALNSLMNGVDVLFFKRDCIDLNWKEVLKNIKFEYIHTRFTIETINEYDEICKIAGDNNFSNISFDFDYIENNNEDLFLQLTSRLKERQHGVFTINGYGIQRTGGTTWQELAFCLNAGHEMIIKLLGTGLEIDEATACINFDIGIGSNYFFETAKIRALRQLWSKIIAEYNPLHNCSHNCMITGIIGHTNKSLKDPYTNLLRQTTETMSAVNGGVNNVLVLPYDLYSTDGPSSIAMRMASNISLILKEESYFDKVIDSAGGSYSIEKLTELIGEKAYLSFQKLEAENGLLNQICKSNFSNSIELKRDLKTKLFAEGKIIGIGMNKYPNPDEIQTEWTKVPSYMNIESLLFDQISKSTAI